MALAGYTRIYEAKDEDSRVYEATEFYTVV